MVFIWGGGSNCPCPSFAPGGGAAGGGLCRVSCARRARASLRGRRLRISGTSRGGALCRAPAPPARLCGVSTGAAAVTLPAPALGSTSHRETAIPAHQGGCTGTRLPQEDTHALRTFHPDKGTSGSTGWALWPVLCRLSDHSDAGLRVESACHGIG